MTQFCTECGAAIEPGVKFCVNCGAKAEAAEPIAVTADQAPAPEAHQPVATNQPAQPQPAPAPAKPDNAGPVAAPSRAEVVKPIGFFWSLWHLFLMNIPVLGLILSLVWGLRTKPKNRSNLARAMIFINLIWLAVAVMLGMSAYSFLHQLSQVADYSIQVFGISLRF